MIIPPDEALRLLRKRGATRATFLDMFCSFVCENIRAFWRYELDVVPLYPYGHRVVTTQDGCRRAGAKGHE